MMRIFTVLLALAMSLTAVAGIEDPTRPMTAQEIQAWVGGDDGETRHAALRLQSILISGTRRIAIINGTRVAVDERIENARIEAIEAGTVRLEREGEIIELELDSDYRTDKR